MMQEIRAAHRDSGRSGNSASVGVQADTDREQCQPRGHGLIEKPLCFARIVGSGELPRAMEVGMSVGVPAGRRRDGVTLSDRSFKGSQSITRRGISVAKK